MSSDVTIQEPPLPSDLKPRAFKWPKGTPIIRCHNSSFGATEFNPGEGGGRFHPLRGISGGNVPTLYGSSTIDGALSETVFHNVPIRGPGKAVSKSSLLPMVFSTIAATRLLNLVQLHGHGLRRIGVKRIELIESESNQYPATRRWAEALHRSSLVDEVPDGLVWMSRQHDTSTALVLFGDRISRDSLEVVSPPSPLAVGRGLEDVLRAAEEAGILIVE